MATIRNTARRVRRPANGIDRSPKKVAEILLRSFVHALTAARCTQASAAQWMGVSLSTVQKAIAGSTQVNASHVLRSERLALPFARHVCRLVAVRNHRKV